MHKICQKDVDDMMEAVYEAYIELDIKTLRNVWLFYQYIMNEMFKVKGSNDYLVLHVNKKKKRLRVSYQFKLLHQCGLSMRHGITYME